MSVVEIRPAKTTDADALAAVIDAAYAPFLASGLDLPPVSDGVAEAIDQMSVWVAVRDGQVIGGIMSDLDRAAHIANLAVAPTAAGGGVGQALIQTVLVAARARGHAKIALATHVDMTRTQAFYRKQGWVETGREGMKVLFTLDISRGNEDKP